MSILELFCSVDDFWQQFAPNWHHSLLAEGQRQRLRPTQMYPSEMMTIMILFHQSEMFDLIFLLQSNLSLKRRLQRVQRIVIRAQPKWLPI